MFADAVGDSAYLDLVMPLIGLQAIPALAATALLAARAPDDSARRSVRC